MLDVSCRDDTRRVDDPEGLMHTAQLKHLFVQFMLACTISMLANVSAFAVDSSISTSNALDGMHFIGETGETGKEANNPDTISFEGGMFRSSSCEALGFGPAPYSVEKQGDTYKFSATLVSADTGTLEFQGTITEGTADATFRWRHTRWFLWNIDRTYWYRGTAPSSQQ